MAFTFKDATRLFQVKPGRKFSLKHHDPGWAGDGEFKDLRKGALKERAVEYLQKNIPNCTLRIIDNVGHCPHLSAPSASADAMEQFLSTL